MPIAKYTTENYINQIMATKKDVPSYTTNITNPLVLSDNTEYLLTNVANLTLQFPNSKFEVWMKISFAATENVSVTFPATTQFIGAQPTFRSGETWEISIKDGVAICWRVQ